MKIYVNDMLVKSRAADHHITDFKEAFATPQQFQMKLNLSKCTFKVTSNKFLDFMMSRCGIKVNSKKIQAPREMTSLRTIKEI